jgi:hypothetical protein
VFLPITFHVWVPLLQHFEAGITHASVDIRPSSHDFAMINEGCNFQQRFPSISDDRPAIPSTVHFTSQHSIRHAGGLLCRLKE